MGSIMIFSSQPVAGVGVRSHHHEQNHRHANENYIEHCPASLMTRHVFHAK